MMNTQQKRSEETRNRLLNAAEKCFAQDGYDAAGVAKICQYAGVSKGAFYHHFSSKQMIFMALFKQWLEGVDLQLTHLRDNMEDIPEGLISMAAVVQDVTRTAENQLPIYLEFLNRAARDPNVLQAMIEPFHRYHAFFVEMIEAGISQGTLRQIDPAVAARVIISMAVGLLIQGLLDPAGSDWEWTTEESIKIILRGMVKR